MITQQELKEILKYDKYSGIFLWKKTLSNRVIAGKIAGTVNDNGYIIIYINKRPYRAHRLAWLYVHGYMPIKEIDHKDNDKSNNKIGNLREATHIENGRNKKIQKNNTSGNKGVTWNSKVNKWQAQIYVYRKNKYIGIFENKRDAIDAYRKAAKETFGEFYKASI